jgi:hypothetical protein
MTGLGEAASVLPVRTTQMTADKTCNYGKVDNGTCQQMLQFKVLVRVKLTAMRASKVSILSCFNSASV